MTPKLIEEDEQAQCKPLPDIGICATCGWRGHVSKCEMATEQDGWEAPPYDVHLCPVCEDGGCIDDYEYSKEQYIKWAQWNHNVNIKPKMLLK